MRKKKGFTLIELLAVIVILAIIALIAVPVILNIIDKANKSAFKDTAYGIISAGELYFAEQQLEVNGMQEEKTFTLPDTTNTLGLKGNIPTGTMTITRDGNISLMIKNERYCVTKGYNDTDITITENPEDCEITVKELVLGQEIYYNPVTNQICENYTEANSETGVKTGCMKWYIYKMEDDNVGLILDHNTTAETKWNEVLDGDDPTTLNAVLKADTTDQGWKVNASVITIDEVMNMLPWYQNLTDKSNWVEEYFTYADDAEYFVGVNVVESEYATKKEYIQAIADYLAENYSDIILPSYMYEDILPKSNNCTDDMSCITRGYWTSDAVAGYFAAFWLVDYCGSVDNDSIPSYGLRPVISLSKSAIQ